MRNSAFGAWKACCASPLTGLSTKSWKRFPPMSPDSRPAGRAATIVVVGNAGSPVTVQVGQAIARSYAHAHGGELFYEPADPHGARFQLVLPAGRS